MSGTDTNGDEHGKPRRRMATTGLVMGLIAGGAAGLVLGTPLFVSAEDGTTAPSTSSTTSTIIAAQDTTTATTEPTDLTDGVTPPDTSDSSDADATPTPGADEDAAAAGRAGRTRSRAARRSLFAERMHERMEKALDGLVTDGTITREQADAVIDALSAGREKLGAWKERADHPNPVRPFMGGRRGDVTEMFHGMREIYQKLGMSPLDIAKEMMDGRTIAEIATDRGVTRQELIDSVTGPMRAAADEAVADGRLTREHADDQLRRATDAIGSMIDGRMPRMPEHGD